MSVLFEIKEILFTLQMHLGRANRVWYLSPMRAAKAENQIPGPSEWLGMRS